MDFRAWEQGSLQEGPSNGLNQALVGQEGQPSWTPKSGTEVTITLKSAKGHGVCGTETLRSMNGARKTGNKAEWGLA